MTHLMTNAATVPAHSAELLTAVDDFAVLALGGAGAADEPSGTDELDDYLQRLEQIGDLAGEWEYAGLQTACLLFQGYLEAWLEQAGGVNDQVRGAQENWPELVHSYLTLPPGQGAVEAVIRHLQLPFWDPPMLDEDVEMLRELLREERPQTAAGEEAPPVALASDAPVGVNFEIRMDSPAPRMEGPEETEISALVPEGALEVVEALPGQSDEYPDADLVSIRSPEEPHDAVAVLDEPLDGSDEAIPAPVAFLEEVSAAAAVPAAQPEVSHETSPEVDEAPVLRSEDSLVAAVLPAEQPDLSCETAVAAGEQFDASPEMVEVLAGQPDELHAAVEVATAWSEESVEAAVASTGRHDESPETVFASGAEPEELPEELPEASIDVASAPEVDADEDLPPQIAELVAVLLDELPLMDDALERLLQLEMSSEEPLVGRAGAAEVYADYLDRFAEAAETVGFSGLQQVVVCVHQNLDLLVAQPRVFSAGESELLAAWSTHASIYLSAPHSGEACHGLIDWLKDPEWPRPLAADQAQALLSLLQAPTLPDIELEQEIEARPQQATREDVSLALPEDVNPELLDALLQELPGQSQTFSAAIQNLIAGGSQDDIKVAQRMAHTLKGAGNTVGVFGLANLTHHLEDILAALAKQEALPPRSLSLSLMNAADCLEAMGEALSGIGEPPENAVAVLQDVLDWANRIDRDGLPEADDEAPPTVVMAAPEPAAEFAPAPAEAVPAEQSQQSQAAAPTAKTQVAMELVDDLLRLGGETIILSGQVHEQVRRIDERMRAMQGEFERLQRLGGELERLIDIKDLNTDRRGPRGTTEFDSLEMDQYSELHTTSRMLVEAATDASQIGGIVTAQLQRLDTMLITQEQLNRETQEKVFSARMVPIKNVVPRLQRSVRQTCRLTGKQVELHLSGADTLMDGEVLTKLIDPLMHVLRNAVDHGIESAEQRATAGKTASGNIWLDFLREGNNILVRCKDDGAGFDYPAIRSAAESRGLLEPGQQASEEKLRELLLMANFSSRSAVTQTSGRGVGLDVVYSHVLSQGGSLALKSETGKGSVTELRLPVSLISTHALLVRVRGQVMAIADRGIERILHADDGERRLLGGQIALQVDDGIYRVKEFDEILRLAPDRRTGQRAPMPVLLVRERSGVTAVPVEEVLAGTDLVVKEFGHYVPRLPGMLGATILGDGAVTPVLDLPELMSGARGKAAQLSAVAPLAADLEEPHLPMALVVDDSLSARRALVQVMEDAGYEVREARDGMEAAQLVQARRPAIVLADMEMPRMNGIELTAHLRARPETADLPVIMITSRSTAKHRQQAEAAGVNVYLTKPFLDDQLLEHVAELGGQG